MRSREVTDASHSKYSQGLWGPRAPDSCAGLRQGSGTSVIPFNTSRPVYFDNQPGSSFTALLCLGLCKKVVFLRGCGCLFWSFLCPSPTRWQSPYTIILFYFECVNPHPCDKCSALFKMGDAFYICVCYVCVCTCV